MCNVIILFCAIRSSSFASCISCPHKTLHYSYFLLLSSLNIAIKNIENQQIKNPNKAVTGWIKKLLISSKNICN